MAEIVGIIGNATQQHQRVVNTLLGSHLHQVPHAVFAKLGYLTMDGLVNHYARYRGARTFTLPHPIGPHGIDRGALEQCLASIDRLWVFWDTEDPELFRLCQLVKQYEITATTIVL